MAATNQDFTVYQGESKQITFVVVDENGDALDISGYDEMNWSAYLKTDDYNNVKGTSAVISKTLGSGVEAGSNSNEAVLTLAPSDTATIDPNVEYYHELEIVSGSVASIVTVGLMDLKYSKLDE